MNLNINEGGLLSLLVSLTTNEGAAYLVWILCFLAVIAIGYLLGSVNSAILISKVLYRDDIRRYGSGNGGMTNMLRTYGMKAAGLTLVGDVLKTALAIGFAGLLFGFGYVRGVSVCPECYVAGLFAVVGHIFPVYYKFKGGKGVLVTAATALILSPVVFGILILVFAGIVWASKYVSLGSISVAFLYPVALQAYFKVAFAGMSASGMISLCSILLALLIIWCHRGNIQRIMDRTERKISFKKKEKELTDKKDEQEDAE